MNFIFSSLCTCSRTLLPCCPLASFAKSKVTLVSGPVVQEYHRVPHPRHHLISSDPASTQSNEGATGNCSEEVAGNCSEGIPEWLENFTENLEIVEIPAAAEISHDSDPERPTKVTPRKHSIFARCPKDRKCEVCLRTKTTRAPCRNRTGNTEPRAEKFGDLITADHKVLNEEGESRHNHRYKI